MSSQTKRLKTKEIFKDCDIAMAGDLDELGWKASDVERWVTTWGGTFSGVLDGSVTHLLATPEQFRARVPRVRRAITPFEGERQVHVVTPDWLEDSINARLRLRERARRGVEMGEKYVDPTRYHVYRDVTFFELQITLTRNDEKAGNVGQKYLMTLWESNAKPHLYFFTAKLWKKARDKNPGIYRPSKSPKLFDTEFAAFRKFFRKKTGLSWNDRVRLAGTMPVRRFRYQPPTGGKPIGLVDAGNDHDPLPVFSEAKIALPEPAGVPSTGGKPVNDNDDDDDDDDETQQQQQEEDEDPAEHNEKKKQNPTPAPKRKKLHDDDDDGDDEAEAHSAGLPPPKEPRLEKHRPGDPDVAGDSDTATEIAPDGISSCEEEGESGGGNAEETHRSSSTTTIAIIAIVTIITPAGVRTVDVEGLGV